MRILYLGPVSPLFYFLSDSGCELTRTETPIDSFGDADFVVSYGYRHIIKNRAELERMDGRAINLHISYLPWNRGADPNLWSWLEGTQKGVSIHCLDQGIDTGDILAQERVELSLDGTLRSSYVKLQNRIQALFMARWPDIRDGHCQRRAHRGGTYHLAIERALIQDWLTEGWDTQVIDIVWRASRWVTSPN